MRVPRPEHSGHIPCGELKENSCGVGSGNEIPQWWQARCSESTFSGWPSGAITHRALAVAQRRLDRVRQALGDPGLGDQAVDDGVERVLLLLVQADLVVEPQHDPVDAHAREARLAHGLDHVLVLALPLRHERGQHQELRALRELHHLVHDLLRRLLRHGPPAAVAAQPSDPRPEHAQVVVQLRDGAHGRARVRAGRLLLDRDRGRQALDRVVERLLHLARGTAGRRPRGSRCSGAGPRRTACRRRARTCRSRRRRSPPPASSSGSRR